MTVNTPAKVDNTDELIGLLEQQSSMYTQLADLTDQQSAIVVSDFDDQSQDQPGEQLLAVLAQRQRVIDQLVDVHHQLAPYREHWPAIWSRIDDQSRQRIAPLVKQIERMAANIVSQDDLDRRRLEQAQSKVGMQLRKVNSVGAALNAYKTPAPAMKNNRFTNKQV